MSHEHHLSQNFHKRIERLVRDVSKTLVAGIRAALEEEERSVVSDADRFAAQLHDYVASVEPITLADPRIIERDCNTPDWRSSLGGPLWSDCPRGHGASEGINIDDV